MVEKKGFKYALEFKVFPYVRRTFSPKIVYRNIKYGIQNLVHWFPVIWSDRDWDYIYLLIMLRHKLKGMEKFLRKYGYHVDADADADNIKKCILVLNRIIDDVYYDIAFRFHEKKWGELDLSLIDRKNNVHLFRENVTPETVEQERSESSKCFDLANHLSDQDIRYLFSTMARHVREWWD